ncbi:MurR/RpiR family transcriptional regulator [Cohaesibacter celericrescens]|uniref:MurR/RpiR family transcriptional regulator n=1 Tax=Cohaesibacter celericrescens TaxID=2067669 RepID=A0A2N5XLP5_9HYPH|nr:MurR/RpiR family transcriptional regulator [Cohaesibacter celericrescens]PLW75348.1 MurR/RpiR family transcriptional regulator [Cohaesibacter celericrescens]
MNSESTIPSFLGELIKQNSTKLTDADTRILNVLVSDPVRAALENGKEVSSRAGVHPTSAIRLARRLGFKGYPDFRAYLQTNLIERGEDFEHASARMAARLVRAEESGLLASILDGEIAALEQIRNAVSDADIRSFSRVLQTSRRIFVFGAGHAQALSHLISRRLTRSGYDTEDLSNQMDHFPERLVSITSEDVIWLNCFRRPSRVVLEIRKIAQARGAKVLALTDLAGARIKPAPDLHIAVSRGEAGQPQSLVVPMTIANAVILDLAAIDDGYTMRSLAEFKSLRASLAYECQ